jgi:hypothetical protein
MVLGGLAHPDMSSSLEVTHHWIWAASFSGLFNYLALLFSLNPPMTLLSCYFSQIIL